jgi:two-component system, LytTR family, sensor kinase
MYIRRVIILFAMKRNIKLRYTIILGLSLFIPLIVGHANYTFLSWSYFRYDVFQALLYTIILWEGNMFIVKKMKQYFPDPDYTTKRIILLAIIVTIFSASFSILGCFTITQYLFNTPPTFESVFGHLNGTMLLTYCSVALYEGADYFQRYKDGLVENERIMKEKIISQFELLKQQTSPHFLFNSLNTLISIIPDDPELAVKYTQHLSNVYRYVLQNKDQDWVTLETELKFVNSFFFLNKTRFGDYVTMNIHIDEAQQKMKVAPLSLQILIENALKHNIISSDKPLTIDISEQEGRLIVKNNLQRKNNSEGTRLGLQNIVNRYLHLSGKTVQIRESSDFFTVSLPLEIT